VVHLVVGMRSLCPRATCRRARLRTERRLRGRNQADQSSEAMGFRDCVVCGEAFAPTRADAKYCSAVCRQTAYRRRVTDNGGVTDNQQIEAPRVTDADPVPLVMQDSKEDAGAPPQGVAMPEAPSAPPAMTYQEQIEAIMKRSREQVEAIMKQPMLPGDRKRALQAVHNQEAVARDNAAMRARLH
jgi:hypothetical protein